MDISVNIVAVIVAALSTMVVGSVWYSPAGFYKTWAKLAKVKRDPEFTSNKMAVLMLKAFLLSLVTAWVLAYFVAYTHAALGNGFFTDALITGLFAWLGFTAARIKMHDMFEQRDTQLTFISVGYELVTILVMCVVLALFGN